MVFLQHFLFVGPNLTMHVMLVLEIQQTLQGKIDFQEGQHSHFRLLLASWACLATILLQSQ